MRRWIWIVLGCGMAVPCVRDAMATTVSWTNGHSYEAVFLPDNPTWYEARQQAEGMSLNGV